MRQSAELMWRDIEVGDEVTVRLKKTGEEFTTTAYRDVDRPSGVGILGFGRDAYDTPEVFDLLSIEKPKPAPPTTPGSLVTVENSIWESGINHLFLMDDGKWSSQAVGAHWLAEDVASKGFTVIYDAGNTVLIENDDIPKGLVP